MDLIGGETDGLAQPVVAILLTYLAVILLQRLAGLRSFARISGFDFASTIATGSLIASAAIGTTPLWSGLAALAGLFAAQAVIARMRRRPDARRLVDNRPILLMDGPEILHENLARSGLVEADLAAQLRLAGASAPGDVRAVVMETTGDVSVILGPGGAERLSGVVAADIRR